MFTYAQVVIQGSILCLNAAFSRHKFIASLLLLIHKVVLQSVVMLYLLIFQRRTKGTTVK